MTLGFGLALLVLSGAFAAVTYFATSSYLVRQERSTLEQQAIANAAFVHDDFGFGEVLNVQQIVGQLDALAPRPAPGRPTSSSLIFFDRIWYHGGQDERITCSSLPPRFVEAVMSGKNVEQIFQIGTTPFLAVGIQIPNGASASSTPSTSSCSAPANAPSTPLASTGASQGVRRAGANTATVYVGVFNLESTANSLHLLLVALVASMVVLTLLGALLGRWAAGRALSPLRHASHAALAIAGGQLDTRLDTGDLRDLAMLASSFNRMADRLQQRIERDTRFTSDVSHELRSPLTVLANSVSVLEARRDDLPQRAQQALDLVAAEVRRFQRMVGDLLEISRIDAGSADLDVSDVEVGELVRRSSRLITRDSVPIQMDAEAAALHVAADKRRFERVIANLLENADRYGGGVTRLAVESTGSCVRFLVDDEGPGVQPADRERIFERFSRGSTAAGSRGAGGGTGLGLALVAEHVKLHRGRVWVEDRPGGGARFIVEVPLAATPEAPQVRFMAGTPDEPETAQLPVAAVPRAATGRAGRGGRS